MRGHPRCPVGIESARWQHASRSTRGENRWHIERRGTHDERDIVHGEEWGEGIEELVEGCPFPLLPEETEVGGPEGVREVELNRVLG